MRVFLLAVMALFASQASIAGHHEAGEGISENLKTVKASYAAFAAGDMEAWAAGQTEDAKWVMPEGLPWTGTYTGPAEVMEKVLGPLGEALPDLKVTPTAFYESGDKIFVTTTYTATNLNTKALHMITVKDGKMSSFEPYEPTHIMMKAAVK